MNEEEMKEQAALKNLANYWDGQFAMGSDGNGVVPDDWIAPPQVVCDRIVAAVKRLREGKQFSDMSVLVVGCGTSGLSEALHQKGFGSITSIDISSVAIEEMRLKAAHVGEWVVGDCTKLPTLFEPQTFDLCVEKGTADSLLFRIPKALRFAAIEKYFNGVFRITKQDCVFCIASPRRKFPLSRKSDWGTAWSWEKSSVASSDMKIVGEKRDTAYLHVLTKNQP